MPPRGPQDNPPSFAFDTRGFQGGRFVGIKVRRPGHSTTPGLDPHALTCLSLQDIRDFVLHLLANDKAQQWLYVKVN